MDAKTRELLSVIGIREWLYVLRNWGWAGTTNFERVRVDLNSERVEVERPDGVRMWVSGSVTTDYGILELLDSTYGR